MTSSLDLIADSAAAEPTLDPAVGAHRRLSVPCVYCRGPIPVSTFAFWSKTMRLMSADCPECDRRVTLTTSTLGRWLEQSSPERPAVTAGLPVPPLP